MTIPRIFILLFSICTGLTLQAQTFLLENFNTGIPPVWTVINGGTTTHTWFGTIGGYNGQTLDGTQFAFVNSDGAGNIPPVLLHEELISPVIPTGSASNVFLEFDHFFKGISQGDSGHVDVWDGNAWIRLVSYRNNTGAFGMPAHVQLNLSPYLNPNLRVRFLYDDASLWAFYWAVDNVHIYAPLNIDAGIVNVTAPALDGRELTSSALSANEPVSITIRNQGTDTIFSLPLFLQVDAGPVQGPEMLTVPIPPNSNYSYTLTATANLSSVGSHQITVWTELFADVNSANDSIGLRRIQWDNPVLIFPHCQGFENIPDTTVQSAKIGFMGCPEMDFSTSQPSFGRLRTFAGSGFTRQGIRALTLDRSPTGSPDAINFVTLTYNLSGLNAATDQVLMDISLMDHGDEFQLRDSIWIRGCDACPWRRILGWNTFTGGTNGTYFTFGNFDVSAALLAAGQNYSSSFQIRIGQEDNFNAFSISGSDGMTVDDVCLRRVFDSNVLPSALVEPIDGSCGDSVIPVVVEIFNGGRDTIADIPVSVTVSGAASAFFQDTLQGILLPNQRAALLMGNLSAPAGGTLQVEIVTNMAIDQYLADDTLRVVIELLGVALPPIVFGDTICAGDTARLFVQNPNAQLEYYWYDAALNGTLLGEGSAFSSGPILNTDTFFVESKHVRSANVGPSSNAIGNGAAHGVFSDGLKFNAYRAFRLDSLTVYPVDTGWVKVLLRDSAQNLLQIDSCFVAPAQAYQRTVIPIRLDIPIGISHSLSAAGTTFPTMWRNSTGSAFPYSHSNVVEITGTINNLPGYYYYFYDWHISYPDCPGPRIQVHVDTASVLPISAFSALPQFLSVQFQNQSSYSTASFWDFGDGSTSTQPNPQHTYSINGTYNVCLISFNPCGMDTVCQAITVNCAPVQPSFSVTTSQLQLSASNTSQGSVSQYWVLNNQPPPYFGGTSFNYTVPADTTVILCLGAMNFCQDTAFTCDTIALCANLTANFTWVTGVGGLSVDFTSSFTGFPTLFHWDFGDGSSSTAANPSHTYTSSGPFNVVLTITNRCGDSVQVDQSLLLVGIPELRDLQVFPNPTSGRLAVRFGQAVSEIQLELIDINGKRLVVPQAKVTAQEHEIDLRTLASGVYGLRIIHPSGVVVLRIVKQ